MLLTVSLDGEGKLWQEAQPSTSLRLNTYNHVEVRDTAPITENEMEKTMEHEMNTTITLCWAFANPRARLRAQYGVR